MDVNHHSPSPEFYESDTMPWDQIFQIKDIYNQNLRSSNNDVEYNKEKPLQTNKNWPNLPCSRQCSGLVSNKINQLVKQTQRTELPPKAVYNSACDPESDLRKILRNSPEILATPVFSSDDDYTDGPFRFKQLLRPTLGPTESLRKRKVRTSSGRSPWMSDSSQDSNSSKEALYNKRRPQISMGVYYN